MKTRKILSLFIALFIVVTMMAGFSVTASAGKATNPYLDLDSTTTNIKDTKELEQKYDLTVTDGSYKDVTKVKLEWTLNDINASRQGAKKWDPENLKWVGTGTEDVVNADETTATFKITNYSSVKIDAKVEFEAAEYAEGEEFNPTVTYTGVDATTHKTTLDTVVGANHAVEASPTAPSADVTVKVTPSEEDFAELTATTSAKKYGTYTVTISKAEELVKLTFTRTSSSTSLSYNGNNYNLNESFSFKVKKNSVVSIVSTGAVGVGPTQSTLTVDGKTVTQYSETGSIASWFPISNGDIITEDKTIGTFSCILSGTAVTLADGTTKLIDDVTTEDKLMTFNFYEGKIDGNYPMYVMKHEDVLSNVITVTLDNGITLEMCDWQQFFDRDAKTYFDIDAVNYQDAIGKNILFVQNGVATTAKISNATMEVRSCTSYEIFTEYNKNFVVNGILTVEPETYLQGVYTIGEDLKIDRTQYKKDVATYGRYTYEEFADVMTEHEFDVMNIADKKIAVGKGIVSEEWLFDLYRTWTPMYR